MRYNRSLTALLGASLLLSTVERAEDQPGVNPNPIPGMFAIKTFLTGNFVTARDCGGHSEDALTSDGAEPYSPGPCDRFYLAFSDYPTPQYVTIKTEAQRYLSVSDDPNLPDPARARRVLQTELYDAPNNNSYWRFVLAPGYWGGLGLYTIQTSGTANFLTALGGGGKSTAAFHADAKKADTWEYFTVLKCAQLGSNFEYAIRPKGSTTNFFYAPAGGGRVIGAFVYPSSLNDLARFKIIQQPGVSLYALQTSNGINFVTAIQGGGLAHGTSESDNLVTDRTQVQAWETFYIVENGDCTYQIRTASGFFIGVEKDGTNISTRINDIDAAPRIGYIARFELINLTL